MNLFAIFGIGDHRLRLFVFSTNICIESKYAFSVLLLDDPAVLPSYIEASYLKRDAIAFS